MTEGTGCQQASATSLSTYAFRPLRRPWLVPSTYCYVRRSPMRLQHATMQPDIGLAVRLHCKWFNPNYCYRFWPCLVSPIAAPHPHLYYHPYPSVHLDYVTQHPHLSYHLYAPIHLDCVTHVLVVRSCSCSDSRVVIPPCGSPCQQPCTNQADTDCLVDSAAGMPHVPYMSHMTTRRAQRPSVLHQCTQYSVTDPGATAKDV
mmetsp:Transcript_3756/g.8167  ORF Transcript_3756/g.8167 Transcript_3756/m.8167 type:complete len:202 (+) Transcript_3756:646-1251(+)